MHKHKVIRVLLSKLYRLSRDKRLRVISNGEICSKVFIGYRVHLLTINCAMYGCVMYVHGTYNHAVPSTQLQKKIDKSETLAVFEYMYAVARVEWDLIV